MFFQAKNILKNIYHTPKQTLIASSQCSFNVFATQFFICFSLLLCVVCCLTLQFLPIFIEFKKIYIYIYFILQTAPLDLETDNFYPARKSLIESQLQKIYDGTAEMILITSWELHSGTACRGVNWDRHSLPELRAAVTCVGGPCLASLCRHLAQDYRSWSSGMPDLLLWRFHGEYKGEAKLVEVKGPRDCLSEQQRAWLLLLMDCGFNTEVCKVSIMPLST
jgi:hypothetical protein